MSEAAASAVATNVAAVRARIARAATRAGRPPESVRLIAAAKAKPAALVDAAIAAGITDIGESYVQEAAAKRAAVRAAARWHLIGHLQRNKVARALDVFDAIQTVDSLALGDHIDRHAAARGRTISILVEINVGGEATKHGITPAALPDLLTGLAGLAHVSVDGLMAIPPPGPPETTRRYFRQLRELRDRHGLHELSMGMTDDFELAVEEGATMVRVGRALFGARTQ